MDFVRAHPTDLYMALARTVRQALISRWIETLDTQMRKGTRVVVYLSAEYLLGRRLDNALLATNPVGHRQARACVPGPRLG